jgi:predicted nucleic acid-binding protein
VSYWDTSALAKLYVSETDSTSFRSHAAQAGVAPVTAEVTPLEMRRVAFRKELAGGLQPGTAETTVAKVDADAAAGSIEIVEQNQAVVRELDRVMAACYRRNPPLPVRTLDALHLASARVAGENEIVATDTRLRAAALVLGFTLFPA